MNQLQISLYINYLELTIWIISFTCIFLVCEICVFSSMELDTVDSAEN